MFASLAGRQRRPLWGWVTFLLLVAVAGSLFMGTKAKTESVSEASTDAELIAQTELATLLESRDLIAPVTGERAAELGADIDAQIISVSTVDAVRIYSSLGRILYADDPSIVGTRPSYLRNLTFEVASGDAQTQVRSGMLQTYVPIWLSPGGTVVVAEMSQTLGPIASRAATAWYWASFAGCALLLVAIGMVILTSRAHAPSMPVQVFQQAPIRLPGDRPPQPEAPIYQQAGFRQLEEQRQASEARATAAERNLKSVQTQLKEALAQISALEKRSSAGESRSAANDAEVVSLREQLSQTTQRLNRAEIDGKALRERLALGQKELDEARGELATARSTGETEELRRKLEKAQGRADELEALKERLQLAERRADEMSAEMERVEADLEYTAGQLHMSKLSEALREIDHEAVNGDGVDGDGAGGDEPDEAAEAPLEQPVIIRSSRGKGR
jgi:hypothetical protein